MVCMSPPSFLKRRRFFWIRPTKRLQPFSLSFGSSSSSFTLMTNCGFIQNVSAKGNRVEIQKQRQAHWAILEILSVAMVSLVVQIRHWQIHGQDQKKRGIMLHGWGKKKKYTPVLHSLINIKTPPNPSTSLAPAHFTVKRITSCHFVFLLVVWTLSTHSRLTRHLTLVSR